MMMSKPLGSSGSPGVFRPVMLNPVVGDTGPCEHVTPPPLIGVGSITINVVLLLFLCPLGVGSTPAVRRGIVVLM